jgi:hypothetical protein
MFLEPSTSLKEKHAVFIRKLQSLPSEEANHHQGHHLRFSLCSWRLHRAKRYAFSYSV